MTGKLFYLQYGSKKIEYNLLFSDRKTLEISVYPDCSIVVKASSSYELPEIELKLRKRARWILKQIRYFQQFSPRTPKRRYISGETHLYLGRRYQLKVSNGELDMVKLTRGAFLVSCRNDCTQGEVMARMENWYFHKALEHFEKSLNQCWPKFEKFQGKKPNFKIRRMQNRWGSLLNDSTIVLNPELIKAPLICIDYVLTHELCHLVHHNHSRDFYKLLEAVMPNWENRKHKLELMLS